tara:strand:+ start:109 stop:282 length:174 start_codon:yes stop_codon:yes gene_type:complete
MIWQRKWGKELPHTKILLSEDWISIGKKNLEKRMTMNGWLPMGQKINAEFTMPMDSR